MTKNTTPEPSSAALSSEALAAVPTTAYREGQGHVPRDDEVIVEAPLLVRLGYHTAELGEAMADSMAEKGLKWHDLVVTMRTPGQDALLAIGTLISEGIIEHASQVAQLTEGPYMSREVAKEGQQELAHEDSAVEDCALWTAMGPEPAQVEVVLEPSTQVSETCLRQRLLASSSCGICGKTALDDLLRRTSIPRQAFPPKAPSPELLAAIDATTRAHQPLFARCGAVHSCALFDYDGRLLDLQEDVGRHNAFDKLVGGLGQRDELGGSEERIVWLSGRVSFELVHKAIMAGVGTLVAVGAPSQLAVNLAERAHIRLVGFSDGRRFNTYSGLGA